jgi:cyclophilin family peptidyl-prolyl cis-trans isomerase
MNRLIIAALGLTSGALAQVPASPLLNPEAPQFKAAAPDVCVVRLDTTKGTIDIEVTRAWAPRGADRFVNLVRAGYYDQNRFFRVEPGWVQFGINGTPEIAKTWRQQTFTNDPFIPAHSNIRGTIAFAFAEQTALTTQVYISMRDNSATHDKEPFVPFGRVLATGMDVADALNKEHGAGPGGIRAGSQGPFFEGGNAWLDQRFPRLDVIRKASILPK